MQVWIGMESTLTLKPDQTDNLITGDGNPAVILIDAPIKFMFEKPLCRVLILAADFIEYELCARWYHAAR